MKVILQKDVRGLGKKWEVKDVSPGYAMNALIPNGLAKVARDEDLRKLETQKILHEERVMKEKREKEAIARSLSEKNLIFEVKTGEKGEVFGSVTADMIKNALAKQGIHAEKINLPKPLKVLGEQLIEISLGMGISGRVRTRLLPQR